MKTYFLTVWDGSDPYDFGKTYNLGRSKGSETPLEQAHAILLRWHATEHDACQWTMEGEGFWLHYGKGWSARLTVSL